MLVCSYFGMRPKNLGQIIYLLIIKKVCSIHFKSKPMIQQKVRLKVSQVGYQSDDQAGQGDYNIILVNILAARVNYRFMEIFLSPSP